MTKERSFLILFILSWMGVLFAGYLSGVKFFTNTCALGETCPIFWGYPACYYGLAMFAILTLTSYLLVAKRIEPKIGIIGLIIVALIGIVFSGYFTLRELPLLFSQGLKAYTLGLPTCALGLIFYALILVIASYSIRKFSVSILPQILV